MKAISIRKDNPSIDRDAIESFMGPAVYFTACDGVVVLRSAATGNNISRFCTVDEWKEATVPFGGPFKSAPAMLEPCEIVVLDSHIIIHQQISLAGVPCIGSQQTARADA